MEEAAVGPRIDALREFLARVTAGRQDITAQLDAATAEVLDAFEKCDVDVLLLKGRALATLLYDVGEQRGYSDVDLLVAPHQIAAAEKALVGLGFINADHGIDDVGAVVHGQTWMTAIPGLEDQSAIDLHHWLPGSRADPAIVWRALTARRAWIEVGGRRAAALDRPGQAMHLATHAAQHGPAFRKHVDELALALERWPADIWDSAARLAEKIGADEVFAVGLRLLPQGAAVAARLGLPSTAELDWTVRHLPDRPRGTFHLRAFAEATSQGERIMIVRRSLFPGRQWIMQQHPWTRCNRLGVAAAYAIHLARSPVWAARAWWFRRRARRAARTG